MTLLALILSFTLLGDAMVALETRMETVILDALEANHAHSVCLINMEFNHDQRRRRKLIPVYNFNFPHVEVETTLSHCKFAIVDMIGFSESQVRILLSNQLLKGLRPNAKVIVFLDNDLIKETSIAQHYFFTRSLSVVILGQIADDEFVLFLPRTGVSFKMIEVDLWKNGTFQQGVTKLFNENARDLSGKTLQARAVQYKPFFYQSVTTNGEKTQEGIEVDMVKAICSSLNAHVAFDFPLSGTWGEDTDGDGIFDGIVGDLQAGRSDVGFAQFFLMHERTRIMDFSQPYDLDHNCFLTLKPKPLPQIMALIKPFPLITWIAYLSTLAIIVLSLIIYTRYHPYSEFKTPTAVMYVVSISFNESQELTRKLKNSSSRIFFTGLFIFTLILSTGYSSAMVSYLTIPLLKSPINSIKQLAESGIPTGSRTGSPFILKESIDPWIIKMRPDHVAFTDFDEAFRNVSEGNLALFMSKQFLEFNVMTRMKDESGVSKAHIVPECPQFFYIAIGFAKNSIYKEIFDKKIQALRESGLIDKWTRDALEKAGKAQIEGKTRLDVKPLTLNEMQGALTLVSALYMPCIVAFLSELFVDFCKRKRSLKQVCPDALN